MALVTPAFTPQQALRRRYKFWTFTTSYTGSETVEIPTGISGVQVAPFSTCNRYYVQYFDPSSVNGQGIFRFSAHSPLTFGLDASVPFFGFSGNLIVGADDGFDSTIDNTAIFGITVFFESPAQYVNRPDAIFYNGILGSTVTGSLAAVNFIIGGGSGPSAIPYAGRRSLTINLNNTGGTAISNWVLDGITIAPSGTNVHVISTGNTLSAGAETSYALNGADYDYIRLRAQTGGGSTTLLSSGFIRD